LAEVLAMPPSFRPCISILAAGLLLSPSSLAFNSPLSDQAVREAYFLGQRRDERTAEFLEKYRRHLPIPESGPWISTAELFTPYAEIVELSRQRSFNYSAQAAAKDYRQHGNIVRVTVTVEFTSSYGFLMEQDVKQRSGPTKGFALRSPEFWKDFTYRLFDGDAVVEPLDLQGHPTFRSDDNSSVMTGATVVLLYNAEEISSSADTAVVVDTPDGQQVVATFDLASLR
jgi:hypothetical protein